MLGIVLDSVAEKATLWEKSIEKAHLDGILHPTSVEKNSSLVKIHVLFIVLRCGEE